MPPKKQKIDKPESRTAGLLQFFNKQQEKRQETVQKPVEAEIIEDEDDSFEVIFEKCTPGPSTSTPKTPDLSKTPKTPITSTKWGDVLQKKSLASGGSAGRDWQNPVAVQVGSNKKNNDKNRKTELIENGFDETNGNGIFYPIDEPIRPFEMNLVKCVSASNCCIALPSSSPSTPARICAISVVNFLKWFPRCRVLLVSASDGWTESLEQLGLETQITRIQTMAQFKKPKNGLGRILFCTSPQCAVKVVESLEAKEFLEEIRLVLIEIKPNECCVKYKTILNALTVRDTFFRCVVLTTSTSNASRRTASITKRQQMITNLQLTDWIEQTDTDFAFRCSNIPSGVEVKYWKSSENSERLMEIIKKYETFAENSIDEMAKDGLVPSKDIKKCIWTDWKMLTATPSSSSDPEKAKLAEILITCYKYLVLDGIVAARNYVKQCASLPGIQKFTNEIMGIFGGFSEFPVKFQLMVGLIENFLKMDNHVRGVILCRDSEQATEMLNFLELNLPKTVTCMRIVPTGHPSARNLWQISRISTVFLDKKSPKILVIPVKTAEFIGFSDQIPLSELTFIASISRDSVFNFRKFSGAYLLVLNEQFEKLRKDDGQLIMDDGKYGQKETKAMKLGAVERYDFKFEPSRLRLNPANLNVKFFYPRAMGRLFSEEANDISRLARTHIEMSSKEHAELNRRIKNAGDFTPFERKKRKFCILQEAEEPGAKRPYDIEEMSDEMIIWNQDIQYLGDVKASKTTQKLTKYLRGTYEWNIPQKQKRYEYTNEISDTSRLEQLTDWIRALDAQFDSCDGED